MKQPKFNLDREFIKWFYEETYPEMGSNRSQVYMMGNTQNVDNRDYWMRQAFKQGAQAMWNDVNGVLADWACAVDGCDPEMLEPCEVYDRSRENLHEYVNQLELFK